MTPSEKEAFAHYDKIAACKKGAVLIVTDECEVLDSSAGGVIQMYPGEHLRVDMNSGGLSCKTLVGESRIKSVHLSENDFHCVDIAGE